MGTDVIDDAPEQVSIHMLPFSGEHAVRAENAIEIAVVGDLNENLVKCRHGFPDHGIG